MGLTAAAAALGRALAMRAGPILRRLWQWIGPHMKRFARKYLPAKAVHHLDSPWLRLLRYLDDGRYPIGNNLA